MKRKLFWIVAISITPLLLILLLAQALCDFLEEKFRKFERWCFDVRESE